MTEAVMTETRLTKNDHAIGRLKRRTGNLIRRSRKTHSCAAAHRVTGALILSVAIGVLLASPVEASTPAHSVVAHTAPNVQVSGSCFNGNGGEIVATFNSPPQGTNNVGVTINPGGLGNPDITFTVNGDDSPQPEPFGVPPGVYSVTVAWNRVPSADQTFQNINACSSGGPPPPPPSVCGPTGASVSGLAASYSGGQ